MLGQAGLGNVLAAGNVAGAEFRRIAQVDDAGVFLVDQARQALRRNGLPPRAISLITKAMKRATKVPVRR